MIMANSEEKGRIPADPSVGAVPAAQPGSSLPSETTHSAPVKQKDVENQPLIPVKEAARLLNSSSLKVPKVSLLFPYCPKVVLSAGTILSCLNQSNPLLFSLKIGSIFPKSIYGRQLFIVFSFEILER